MAGSAGLHLYRAHRAVYAWFSALQNKQHREEGKMMSSENSGDEKLLTKGEVARLCRVDVRTVDRWLMAGKVGYHRTPSGRVLFRKHDVLKAVGCGQSSSLTQRR
jgi:excisionase family DNA binding protein